MKSVADFLVSYQGELATAAGLIVSYWLPAGWRVIFRKSGDWARKYADFVDAVRKVKVSKGE